MLCVIPRDRITVWIFIKVCCPCSSISAQAQRTFQAIRRDSMRLEQSEVYQTHRSVSCYFPLQRVRRAKDRGTKSCNVRLVWTWMQATVGLEYAHLGRMLSHAGENTKCTRVGVKLAFERQKTPNSKYSVHSWPSCRRCFYSIGVSWSLGDIQWVENWHASNSVQPMTLCFWKVRHRHVLLLPFAAADLGAGSHGIVWMEICCSR